MDLEMVLNELSLKTPASDIPTARQWMSELLSTVRQATSQKVKRVLRTAEDFNNLELAPNYPVRRWRNDSEVSREERSFFRTLTAKAPFWTDVAVQFKDQFNLLEVRYRGQEAQGLGFAIVIDAIAISILSEEQWDYNYLDLKVIRLDENEELIDETVKIVHASRRIHIQEQAEWIKNRIRGNIINGTDLWKRRTELFPNLLFCQPVRKQIQSLQDGNPMLQQVTNKLFELEDCGKIWKSGNFDLNCLASKATPESESRLKKFKEQLTFICPDGERRLFSLHLRMTPSAWRLYFLPKEEDKKNIIVIGYIGQKIV